MTDTSAPSNTACETPFARLGGETTLRPLIERFVDRAFDDMMIGFFFRNADRERVKQKEYELAAQMLGADIAYSGRPLREAHGPHRIMGGQFARRSQILREVMADFGVPADIVALWFEHIEGLRSQVTHDPGGECR